LRRTLFRAHKKGKMTYAHSTRFTKHDSSGKRIHQLDGLRAIAVLMVFTSHAFRSQLLWSGVDLFFMLSGFLITGVLLDLRRQTTCGRYIATFYARRCQRILPPYILALAVTSVLFGAAWLHHWYLYLFLMNTAAFRAYAPSFHGILWSLAVEEQFYIIWPILVYGLSERALAWLSAAMIVAAPVFRCIATVCFPHRWSIHTGLPFRIDLLAAGALVQLVWRHRRWLIHRFGSSGQWVCAITATALFVLSSHPWFQPGADTVLANVWLYELILLTYAGALVWTLSGRRVGLLQAKPMVFLGRISYSVYLIHVAALGFTRRFTTHYLVSALVAFGITVCYAAASWNWLEQPALRWNFVQRNSAGHHFGSAVGKEKPVNDQEKGGAEGAPRYDR
jgi:peptidoglycan/LPS O-acetylase OafA/YrhL